jgi:predicted TIM-barrel fold metal-dependent hydrolase
MIIDFHTHIFSQSLREGRSAIAQRDSCFEDLYKNPKAKMATAEELIAIMDETGVDKSIILNLGWVTHELCVETNDYILESIELYPDRLIGFCAVQPLAGDRAVKEIERCADYGAYGLGELRPDIQGYALDDFKIMEQIVESALARNMIFLLHTSEPVGHGYPGKGTITPDRVYPFIQNFPELKIVCAHWGGGLPFYALMPEVAEALKNVYFDTAATPFLYDPQIFDIVANMVGSDRILFGSDCPLMSPRRVIDQLMSSQLDEESKRCILGDNAQTLLSMLENERHIV